MAPESEAQTRRKRIEGLPEPQDLTCDAITELEANVDDIKEAIALLEQEEGLEV